MPDLRYCHELPRKVRCKECGKTFHLKKIQKHFHCGTMLIIIPPKEVRND